MIFLFLYPIILLILDLVLFNIFNQWVSYFLLSYLICQFFYSKSEHLFGEYYFPLILFLLQNSFSTGRFGICLLYLIPIAFIAYKIKNLFDYGKYIIYGAFILLVLVLQLFLVQKLILFEDINIYSTIKIISINIIGAYLVLLGMRGNRSLFNFK